MRCRKISLVFLMVCLCAAFISGCAKKEVEPEFSQLGAICELATFKCYYHNVAEYKKGSTNFFFDYGYKKMWIEYSGIVKIGINVSKIALSKPDENGLIRVSLPKAEVFDVDFDEESISILSETGLFSKVSTKNKLDTFTFAQEDMKKTAMENEFMLLQGQARAKKVIEGYIHKVGAAVGKTYTVEWVEEE